MVRRWFKIVQNPIQFRNQFFYLDNTFRNIRRTFLARRRHSKSVDKDIMIRNYI